MLNYRCDIIINKIIKGLFTGNKRIMNKLNNDIIYTVKYNLDQVSKLIVGQKLVVDDDNRHIAVDIGAMQPITRYWKGQNRSETIRMIITNIDLCMFIITTIYDIIVFRHAAELNNDIQFCDEISLKYKDYIKIYKELIDSLKKSVPGINALHATYSSDVKTQMQLNNAKEKVEVFLSPHIIFVAKNDL